MIIFVILCNYISIVGQTCGSYYGDCRGLPTYALVGIISLGIILFSICLRCCIQINANNSRRSPISVQNPGTVPVYSYGNNLPTRSSTAVPVHNIREDAPPSYAAATSTGLPKY